MKSFKFHVIDHHETPPYDLGEFEAFKAAVEAMYTRQGSHFFTWYRIDVQTPEGESVCGIGWHHYLGAWYLLGEANAPRYGFNFQEHLDTLKETV